MAVTRKDRAVAPNLQTPRGYKKYRLRQDVVRSRPYQRKPRPTVLKDGSVPEHIIQRQILVWLETTGLLFWRQNAGTAQIGPRRVILGPDGISDIVVIIPPNGRFLGLEVKSANGVVRKDQKLFKERLEASGGIYRVVRSLDQAKHTMAEVLGGETCPIA